MAICHILIIIYIQPNNIFQLHKNNPALLIIPCNPNTMLWSLWKMTRTSGNIPIDCIWWIISKWIAKKIKIIRSKCSWFFSVFLLLWWQSNIFYMVWHRFLFYVAKINLIFCNADIYFIRLMKQKNSIRRNEIKRTE